MSSDLQFEEDPILPTRPPQAGFRGYQTDMRSMQQDRFQSVDNPPPMIIRLILKTRVVKTETQAQLFVILFLVIVIVITIIIFYRTSSNSGIIRLQ